MNHFYADQVWSHRRRDVGLRRYGNAADNGVTVVFHGGHGTDKTSTLATASVDAYAKSCQHEQWFMACSF